MVRTESKSGFQERGHTKLFVIVLVALALRLLLVSLVYQDQLSPRRDHWPFGYETGRIARSIAQGEGFANPLFEKTGPTAWMTPVYPYLVAGVFKLFGIYTKSSAIILLSLNSLFSALTCVPIFFIARDSFGQRTAVWSGWVWAFFPYSIYFAVSLVWETTLTTLLVSWLFLLSLRLSSSTSLAAWAGYGLLWGITALTNPSALTLLPLLAGWACYRLYGHGRPWAIQLAVSTLALVIMVAPWFVRNYRTFHQFIPFRDAFWLVMHVGNNGDTSHWDPDTAHPSTNAIEEGQYNRLGELNYMAEKKREVIQFIAQHPGSFVRAILRRVVFVWTGYWSLSREYLAKEPSDPWNILTSMTLLLFMFLGIRRAIRESNAMIVPYAFALIAYLLVYYVSFSQLAYRHPIDPLIAVLATYGAMGTAQSWRSRGTEASEAALQA